MRIPAILFMVAVLLVGCASAIPPAPPLTVAVSDGPREHSWPWFRWTVGDRLVYREHCVTERQPAGGRASSSRDDTVTTLRAEERTARATRVSVSNGSQLVGSIFFDQDGVPQDAVGVSREITDVFQRVLGWAAEYIKTLDAPLRLGEPIQLPFDVGEVFGLIGSILPHSGRRQITQMPVEYLGAMRLGTREVVAFRIRVPGLPQPPLDVRLSHDRVTLWAFESEDMTYFDAARKHRLANYGVTTMEGTGKEGRVTVRVTCRTELDEPMSRIAP